MVTAVIEKVAKNQIIEGITEAISIFPNILENKTSALVTVAYLLQMKILLQKQGTRITTEYTTRLLDIRSQAYKPTPENYTFNSISPNVIRDAFLKQTQENNRLLSVNAS